MDAEEEFELAWNNPKYTQIMINDVNINEVLEKYYDLDKPLAFTRKMLWDMECKKAWDPKTYVPNIMTEKKAWGRKTLPDGNEEFVRAILPKRQWDNPNVAKECFEKVYLNHKKQIATFRGTRTLIDPSGKEIHTDNDEPLYY